MSRRLSLHPLVVLLLAVTPLLASCSKKTTNSVTGPAPPAASALLSTLAVGASAGTFVSSPMPTGTTTAPVIAASDSFVAGTNALLTITVPDTTVALLVGATGHMGYFRATVASAQRASARARADKYAAAGVRVMSLRPSAVQGTVDLVVTVGVMAGQTSAPLTFVTEGPHSRSRSATHTFYASHRAESSGQLQFSLSWSAPVDLDLHVQVPVGADSVDICWMNPIAAGGSLDLDSNAGCGLDNVDNENITWGDSIPAHGTYKVRVDLWSACDVTSPIPYVVTIRKCGVVVQTIHGTALPAEADTGNEFSGKLVGTVLFAGCTGPAEPGVATTAAELTKPWQRGLRRLAIR